MSQRIRRSYTGKHAGSND